MNTTASKPINLPAPRTARRMPGSNHATARQAPYAPAHGPQPYGRPAAHWAQSDEVMLPLSLVGLIVTTVMGLPVGIVTGPLALGRASRAEQLIAAGHRPTTDRSRITTVRICAWISMVWSALTVLVIALILGFLLSVA